MALYLTRAFSDMLLRVELLKDGPATDKAQALAPCQALCIGKAAARLKDLVPQHLSPEVARRDSS